jgi:precorrin-2 dehydrogenase / sirohydrochlorin ferrochelatase
MQHDTHGYPIVLRQLRGASCCVVGGGAVAERKAGDLITGGAQPIVISPSLTPQLAAWAAQGLITHIARAYQPGDLARAFLVIAATDAPQTNAQVAEEGRAAGALVNVADSPDDGNFHTVATVRRGDLLLTVSTSGASPTVAARIRGELAAAYGEEYGDLLRLLRSVRAGPHHQLARPQRALFWSQLSFDALLGWLQAGLSSAADYYVERQIARAASAPAPTSDIISTRRSYPAHPEGREP